MRTTMIIAVLISLVALVFVIQNIGQVEVAFFTLKVEAPLAVILFTTFLIGSIAGALFMIPSVYRSHKEKDDLRKEMNRKDSVSTNPTI